MFLRPKIEQKQTQRLSLTPQVKLALHLLQLPLMELNTFLKQQIVENPLLEVEEREENSYGDKKESASDKDSQKDEIDKLVALDEEKTEVFTSQRYDQEQEKKRRYRENIIARVSTLDEHLMLQLDIFSQSTLQRTIGEAIIGNIDKNGYLRVPLEEIAQGLNVGVEDAEKTLSLIQGFSPSGVGAKSLSECLVLQLKRRGRNLSLAAKIARMHLRDLEKRQFKKIAKSLGVLLEEVKNAFLEISRLEPKPGRSFGNERTRYVTADILLFSSTDGHIEISNEGISALRISPYYKKLLRDINTADETKKYLKKKLNQALWLVKAIKRRHDTIGKVGECIVNIQKDFLEKGPAFIKPLGLKDVAQVVGVNESTVSRAIANKYIDTPHGVFALKSFFNGAIKQNNGEALSNGNVKSRIKGLIDSENARKPLSDETIVRQLHCEGIDIVRRTVTKYRKLLRIPSSNLRKEN